MFIVCFIHSFWTCGNQNQQCNYTFCCLCGTGSGQMLWGGSSFPGRSVSVCWHCWTGVSHLLINLHLVNHLSQHLFSLLLEQEGTSHSNVSTPLRPSVKSLPEHWWGFTLASAITSTAAVFCLPNRSSACSTSGSSCLPAVALGIRRNIRRELLALLYMVSSRCGYWAEPTGKCLWSVRQKFRLSHKQLCLHCSLLWLHHCSPVVRDLGASSSFPLKGSMWAREQGSVCSHVPPALQGQYVTLKVRPRLTSRPDIHCLVTIM